LSTMVHGVLRWLAVAGRRLSRSGSTVPTSDRSSWMLEEVPRRDREEQYHLWWPGSLVTWWLGSFMVGVRETSRL
jgi:hypothetical protein